MSENLVKLEEEIRHVLGIGPAGKTPVHVEVLAVAVELEQKDAALKSMIEALNKCRSSAKGTHLEDVVLSAIEQGRAALATGG